MSKLEFIKLWYKANELNPNFLFENYSSNVKCVLYLPFYDKNIVSYSKTKKLAKQEVIEKAYEVLKKDFVVPKVEYHLETKGSKNVLHVKIT